MSLPEYENCTMFECCVLNVWGPDVIWQAYLMPSSVHLQRLNKLQGLCRRVQEVTLFPGNAGNAQR